MGYEIKKINDTGIMKRISMEDLTSTIPNSYNNNNWKIPMVEEYSFEDDKKKDNALSNINSVDDLNADNIEQYVAEVVNNGDCFKGKSYEFGSDLNKRLEYIKKITALCIAENGNSPRAVAATASVLCNNTDKYEKYDPIIFINNIEWYAPKSIDCFNDSTNLKKYKRDIITPKAVANVYDVVVNGNRTSKADEHDCFSDIEKIEYNGEIYTNAHEEDIMNRDFYKKGETVVYNRFGSKFLFDFFPSDNPNCDPYGIKLGEWK